MSLLDRVAGLFRRRVSARARRRPPAAPPVSAEFAEWVQGWGEVWGIPHLAPRVHITFSRRLTRSLGRCTLRTGAIRLNPRLLADRDALREVVCHEAAHAAAWILHGDGARPHGREWKDLMRRAGYEPRVRWGAR